MQTNSIKRFVFAIGFFVFIHEQVHAQCASATVTLNGFNSTAGSGTYDDPAIGMVTVDFCIKLDKYFELNTNWVHGIFISFDQIPKGVKICEGPTGSQPCQHGSRFWIFLDSTKAAQNHLPGPGFYVDEGDGNPGNNYGDNGIGTPQATFPDLRPFCFQAKIDCNVSSAMAYLAKITITGDGTTGAWENSACDGDEFRALDGGPNGNGTVVVCGAVLPVKLLSFTGEATSKGNSLKWLASSDQLFSHFELERSKTTSARFQSITKIEAKKGSTGNGSEIVEYNYFDPETSLNSYYRLKMLEKDGSFNYSKIISIQNKDKGFTGKRFVIYPNPVSDILQIQNEVDIKLGLLECRIYDICGQLMASIPFSVDKSGTNLYFDISLLSQGVYFVDILSGDQSIEKLNFIKQ
ncbi:MAG: T9SS type A sorting domain-containing protein [Saprospiraceae bacterium]|nr:T9SS type A sorting domain-containing protein [Saprospiraceae bacterium]HRG68654.1 T9SS type A sorting domain-containing protein [Saprospiraceae bacterium]